MRLRITAPGGGLCVPVPSGSVDRPAHDYYAAGFWRAAEGSPVRDRAIGAEVRLCTIRNRLGDFRYRRQIFHIQLDA